MEFRLDWMKGEARLERVLYRTTNDNMPLAFRSGEPQTPMYIGDHRYFTNAFTQNPTNGHNTAFLFADRGKVAVPMAAMGRADEWDVLRAPAFVNRWPKGKSESGRSAWFVWSDLDGDGHAQPEEVAMLAGDGGGVTVQDGGAFIVARLAVEGATRGQSMRFRPTRVTPLGAPVYDLAASETIVDGVQRPISSGGGQALVGTQGWSILTTPSLPFSGAGIGGVRNGVPLWSYPSLWPGLNASHSAPIPDFPGELIGTTRLLGDFVTPRDSDAGPLFFLNGNLGNVYVFTQDGLMVATLFRDKRIGQAWEAPSARRGMRLDDVSPGDELFFPTVNQTADREIYLVAGHLFSAIVRVDGLETVRRIQPFPLHVTREQLTETQTLVRQREAARQAGFGRGVFRISVYPQGAILTERDWTNADWVDIDRRGVGAYFNANTLPYAETAAAIIVGRRLEARWKTGDAHLLKNSGVVKSAPFKTGGALDLMLATDPEANPRRKELTKGDLRLLVSLVNGNTKALLYRSVVPGTRPEQQVVFRSPARTVSFDRVEDVSDRVQLTVDGWGNYQVSVPLELRGWAPRPGEKFRGDIGILRGTALIRSSGSIGITRLPRCCPMCLRKRPFVRTCGELSNAKLPILDKNMGAWHRASLGCLMIKQ